MSEQSKQDRFSFKRYDEKAGKEVFYKQYLNSFATGEMIELSEESLAEMDKEKLIDIISELCIDLRSKESQIKSWQEGFELFVTSKKDDINRRDSRVSLDIVEKE